MSVQICTKTVQHLAGELIVLPFLGEKPQQLLVHQLNAALQKHKKVQSLKQRRISRISKFIKICLYFLPIEQKRLQKVLEFCVELAADDLRALAAVRRQLTAAALLRLAGCLTSGHGRLSGGHIGHFRA